MMDIFFRPHHFLCALCFRGKGYTSTFVSHFQAIMDKLNKADGNSIPITIINHTDSICEPCPHRSGKACASQEKITSLDQAHAKALALESGMITWGEAKKAIKEKINLAKFHEICADCEWKKFGICENVLTQFLETTNKD